MTFLLPPQGGPSFWSVPQVQPPSLGSGPTSKLLDERLRALHTLPPSSPQWNPSPSKLEGDVAERLFNASAMLKVLVSQVSMHLPGEWRKKLFRSLDRLYNPENWEESDKPIDVRSFMTFLRLILHNGPLNRMSLGVSPGGHLLAGWIHNKDSLTLEFAPDDEIRWSLVRYFPGKRESAAGRTTLERLEAVLNPYAPEVWFVHADSISS